MPELKDLASWPWIGGGGAAAFFAVKYLWPSIRDSLSGQSAQWRSENQYIKQLEEARRQAEKEKREAEERADKLFEELTNLKAQVTVMQFEMESLKKALAQYAGEKHA